MDAGTVGAPKLTSTATTSAAPPRLQMFCLNTCSYLQLHPHPHLLHLLPDHLDASPHPLPALITPPGQLLGESLPKFQSMQQQLLLQNLKHQAILAFQ